MAVASLVDTTARSFGVDVEPPSIPLQVAESTIGPIPDAAALGMTSIGQCSLLARRLVEAGCRFVSIENGHWDTHRRNTWSLRELLCPSFDQAIPVLLNDLEDRGLLESTLVVVTTEFGRTPRINDLAGRPRIVIASAAQ